MQTTFHDIVSGRQRGLAGAAARLALHALEPAYVATVRWRNRGFDSESRSVITPPRPVVSVGNLTVGGTGKTPIVSWLAGELNMRGRHPAVLMRGYKARPGQKGDEQRLLEQLLGPDVPVVAKPDRAAAAERVVAERPETDVFVLDDGFQHRRLGRVFDLVLVDASNPFGHGHVLPRGLLREPISGLSRASAVLITRCGPSSDLPAIEAIVRQHTQAPLFRSSFRIAFETPAGADANVNGEACLVACGIGNPAAFVDDVKAAGADVGEVMAFADHHDYTPRDVERIAAKANGRTVVVTGKDWVKLRDLWSADVPVRIATQAVDVQDGEALVASVLRAVIDAASTTSRRR